MRNVLDYAKYFMKNATGLDKSFDGNMKLQKLLVFSNLVNMALNNKPLFKEQLYAFRNGCIVDSVRRKYRNDYLGLKKESESFEPNFSECELETLEITLNIFDKLSAKELSDLNHEFDFWKDSYVDGKNYCIVSDNSIKKELPIIKNMIDSYKNRDKNKKTEVINGITFYYDHDKLNIYGNFIIDNKFYNIIDELYDFTLSDELDENCYSVYLDEFGELVIF